MRRREFKVDITLAAEMAQFLEGLLNAEFNEEFDAEAPCTDTFLDQFMPNGHVPAKDLIDALLNSGIIIRKYDPTDFEAFDLVPILGSPGEYRAVRKV